MIELRGKALRLVPCYHKQQRSHVITGQSVSIKEAIPARHEGLDLLSLRYNKSQYASRLTPTRYEGDSTKRTQYNKLTDITALKA